MDYDPNKLRLALKRLLDRRTQLRDAFYERLQRDGALMDEEEIATVAAAFQSLTPDQHSLIEMALETGFRVGRPDADRGDFIFIAYASEDRDAAAALCDELSQAGVRCFLDDRNIEPGADWDEAITAALSDCAGLLVLISPAAVAAAKRGYIKSEIQAVFSQMKPVFPVLLDATVAPERIESRLRTRQAVLRGDATALKRLIDKLRSLF